MTLLPLLTEKDEVHLSQGSIDPLGLYTIADSLATRLVPGVRERQSRIRFLTAMAVSFAVCSELAEAEMVASDGISEPWQVFEWYVVEALVRTAKPDDDIRGLPGQLKAAKALQDKVPLSASRYLKTPTVFGFHGVYRVLSRMLGLEVADRLGSFGYELLMTWSKEQGLKGFYGTAEGPGSKWRRILRGAVKEGIKKGATAYSPRWDGWSFIKQHLSVHNPGPDEAKTIAGALLDPGGGFRKPVLEYLVSSEGATLWRKTTEAKQTERHFHEQLIKSVRSHPDLQELLTAIISYELFSRLLQDAFDDCLYRMTNNSGKTQVRELARLPGVMTATQIIPELFARLLDRLAPFGKELTRFQDLFAGVSERLSPEQWTECLLEHHMTVQRNKHPNGKAPWFERFDTGGYIVRPAYRRSKGGRHDKEYVHYYRTTPLWSFANDLRLVH